MNIPYFSEAKKQEKKISMVTAYDFQTAQLLSKSEVDVILVGDSVAMVCHGFDSTVHATMDMMELHTAAVARGKGDKLLVADLPFGSYRKGLEIAMDSCERLMRAGATAVKLEGAKGNLELISHIVDSGIPVMGHVGLTPQSVNQLGGHKVQGREQWQAEQILRDSEALEKAGCFSLVIECVPQGLAKQITKNLKIPTIGIGAGPHCDGQVLVFYDMLGFEKSFRPKFVRRFFDAESEIVNALNDYHEHVSLGTFPNEKELY